MKKLSADQLNFKGKRALLRVDFNVPLNDSGEIIDDSRIRAALPTIRLILEGGGSVVLMSHLGRPNGKKVAKLSLAPCAKCLSDLLGQKVKLAPDSIGPDVEAMAKALAPGEALMLENLRFHEAEENPDTDPSFAKQLAHLGDIYVNDAFGTAHRRHSSTATIASYFPETAAAGLLLKKEIEFLGSYFKDPQRPFYAIIGGAKVSTKIGVLKSLLSKVNALFIGGGMAYTFFKAQGIAIGNSLCEEGLIPEAQEFLALAENENIPIHLPSDVVIADAFSEQANIRTIPVIEGIPDGWEGMDIGPKTLSAWKKELESAAMIFWNGPVGVFEMAPFAKGTEQLAQSLSHISGVTIAGGGDSVAAINQLHLAHHFSHISTGGGAALEYIEHGQLPGIEALTAK
jgi:phosphoglycerate kinase